MMENKKNIVDTQFTLAKMWDIRGKFERAISGYQHVINLQPDYVAAHLELGGLLTKQGRIEEALAVYRRAKDMNPNETVFLNIIRRLSREQVEPSRKNDKNNRMASVSLETKNNGLGHILLYTDSSDTNGTEQCNHLILCELKSLGYQVTCAQPKASHNLINERNRLGIPHIWIEQDDIYHKIKTATTFINFTEAENLFISTKPDLIIFASGCPLSSLAAKQMAVRRCIPYIEIIHCVTAEWAKQFASHLHKLREIYYHASNIITVSRDNLDLLREYFGLPEGKGQVIYNGRPNEFFNPQDSEVRERIRQELNIPSKVIVAFTSGRMEIVKGYQYQIEAIKNLRQSNVWPNLYFVWAGSGTIENNLRAAVERLGATNQIRFLGQRDDIPALLDAADIFILPSHFEGMPLSIMEAMAKGLPVIATSVSGIPEELGNTGKLLPDPGKNRQAAITELVNTIESWVQDKKLRHSIGKACKQRAEKMFRIETMLKKYIETIETIVIPAKSVDEVNQRHV